MMEMTKEHVRIYVDMNGKDAEDCMEYLDGLANKNGTYNQSDVERFLNR